MIFCVGEGKYESKGKGYQKNLQIFNTPVTEEEYKKVIDSLNIKKYELPITKWIDIKEIKNPTTTQTQIGGSLKKQSYKNAWREMWDGFGMKDRDFFTSLPHFNPSIFKEITGIDVEQDDEVTIKISRKSAEARR